MGEKTLRDVWPEIARWIRQRSEGDDRTSR
jgi:hypothetical protein